MAESPVRFEGSAPILRVENMEASLHFYVDLLGFTNADWGGDDFTNVRRDDAGIYLCLRGQGRGGSDRSSSASKVLIILQAALSIVLVAGTTMPAARLAQVVHALEGQP